jgi:WD40 repeat protein/tRNA A-37 threonylcarbamoyl transferase component Bud32
MSSASNPSHAREERFQLLVADWLEQVRRGTAPDRAVLLSQHPEYADELRAFFEDHDRVQSLAAPLMGPASTAVDPPSSPGDQPTLPRTPGPAGTEPLAEPAAAGPLERLRYFGDYELIQEIARGGMGVVYKARQTSLNRTVAVKMILAGQLAGPEDVRRFLTEAEAAAALQHANIVPIYEVGEHLGQHYFSMAYVDGPSLAHLVRENPLPPRMAASLVQTVARAIQYAHDRGILHRDLKPSNVLLARAVQPASSADRLAHDLLPFEPMITDFGLARRIEGGSELTGTGQVLGTPSYMPPEQAGARRGQVGPHSDVYSLGAILYELLTGRPPFRAATPLDTLLQVIDAEPVPPHSLNSRIPLDLETVCLKCLQKDPAKRYASAAALADDLARYLEGRPIIARPVGSAERLWRWARRNPIVAALTAALVLVLTAGLAATSLSLVATAQALSATKKAEADARAQKERADQKAEEATAAANRAQEEKARADAESRAAGRHLYAAHMNLVERDWTEGKSALVLDRMRLYDGREDLVGFEWHLQRALSSAALRTYDGHTSGVKHALLTDNGQTIVSAGSDGTVRFWNLVTGQQTGLIQASTAEVKELHALAISNDGRFLATSGYERVLVIWNRESGQPVHSLKHEGLVRAIAFSADGARVAAGGSAGGRADFWGMVRVLNAKTGQPLWSAGPKNADDLGEVKCVAFSADGARLYAAHAATVRVHNAEEGKEVAVLSGNRSEIHGMALSADGARLATADEAGQIKIWNLAPVALERSITAGAAQYGISFSPDGAWVAAAGGDGAIRVFSVESGRPARALQGHQAGLASVAWSPDGWRVVSASQDKTVRLWDARSDQTVRALRGMARGAVLVAFSSDGRLIAAADGDATVRVFDVATGREIRTLVGHKTFVSGLAFHPLGTHLATADERVIRVWRLADGREVLSAEPGPLYNRRLAWTGDGTMLAWSMGHGVMLANAQTLEPLRTVSAGQFNQSWSFLITAKSGRLLLPGKEGALIFCDLANGRELARRQTGLDFQKVVQAAISPDEQWLAASMQDNTIRLVPLRRETAGRQHADRTLAGHAAFIRSLCFSPDGRRIASCGDDRALKIWDVESGQELRTLRAHGSSVMSAAFSPDGTMLVSGGADSSLVIWEARRQQPEGAAEREARGLVEHLYSSTSDAGAIQASIANDPTISEAVRARALALAAQFSQEEPARLHGAAWGFVIEPPTFEAENLRQYQQERYAQGLRLAQSCCQRVSDNADFLTTLGLAQYRSGQYAAAAETLAKAQMAAANKPFPLSPANLALLAMAQHELGAKADALALLHQARASAAAADPVERRLSANLLEEAASLVGNMAARVLREHKGLVSAVVYSPDGTRLASASSDTTVKIWDAESWTMLHSLDYPTHASLAFSPNGKQLIGVGGRWTTGRSWVWDAETGKEVQGLSGTVKGGAMSSYSLDGTMLATAAQVTFVWDAATGKQLSTLPAQAPVAFGPNGLLAAVGARSVQQPDAQDGTRYRLIERPDADRQVEIWDPRREEPTKSLRGQNAAITALAWHAARDILAAADEHGTILLWTAQAGTLLRTMRHKPQVIRALSFSADGRLLATAGTDRSVRVWNVDDGSLQTELMGHAGEVLSVSFSPRGGWLASGGKDGTIRLWQVGAPPNIQD